MLVVLILLAVLLLGFLLGWMLRSKRMNLYTTHQNTHAQVQDEHLQYQAQVSDHLAKTLDHIKQIERQSQAVKAHLLSVGEDLFRIDGAERLELADATVETNTTCDNPKADKHNSPQDYIA